jgi:hypothetical protein
VALSDSGWQWICTLVPVIDFIVFFSGDAALGDIARKARADRAVITPVQNRRAGPFCLKLRKTSRHRGANPLPASAIQRRSVPPRRAAVHD